MELSQFLQVAKSAEVRFSEAELEVLKRVTGGIAERFDLETILADLSTAVRFVNSRYARDEVGENSVEALRLVRAKVNRALALACDLATDESREEDELKAHKAFFARVLASRRSDLPRARVFTTNYDLVIEKALDVLGIDYIDGFVGTVNRTLRLDVYSREYYMATAIGSERRPRRLADFLYLYKVHGSLNWRSRANRVAAGSDRVVQISNYRATPIDDLALIYPTPQKEADTLGYPYSDLLRAFGSTLTEPDTALFTIGYGYSDEHINRIISQSLASNATLAIVLVDPFILETTEEPALADT
ncbi:MAG TPA: SIR2 family protein, partial [Xanthomonadales bacterium]|nr:SIR2 family protein [Xanthomonadales bacterium]